MLQRSANPRSTDMMDVSVDSRSPSPKETTPRSDTLIKTEIFSNIDPALASVSSPSGRSDSGESARERAEADRAEEEWINNIRVVEALRRMISERLEHRIYEADENTEDISMSGIERKAEESPHSLYPVLRADVD
jgi:hypothetical protein